MNKHDFSASVPKERNHLLLLCSLAFVLGCVLCTLFFPGPWLWIVFGLGLLLFPVLLYLNRNAWLALILCFFAAGMLRTNAAWNLPAPDPGSYEVNGFVTGEPVIREDGRITFLLKKIKLNNTETKGTAYCTLNPVYLKEPVPELFDGAQVTYEGRVYLPEGKSGPVHFDFRQWMTQNRYSFGISTYTNLTVLNTPKTAPVMDLSARIRCRIEKNLSPLLKENTPYAMAFLFGDKTGLTDAERESFQKLGIAHLLSVSGLHIGIVGLLLMRLMKALKANRTVSFAVVSVFVLAYSWLSGFSAASLRAAVMLILSSLFRLWFRASDRRTTLAFSAMIILLINPLQAVSAGFLLSYSAMLGILCIAPPVEEFLNRVWPTLQLLSYHAKGAFWHNRYRRLQMDVKSGFALSLAAQIGTLLPTAHFFHCFPTYGLLINLLLVPFAGAVLTPVLLITSLVSFVPVLGTLSGLLSGQLLDLFLRVVVALSALPGAILRIADPGWILCLGLTVSAVLLSRIVPGRIRTRLILSSVCAVITISLSLLTRPASLRYIQLSTGQSDAAVLMDGKTTVLIDTGVDGQETLDYLEAENRSVDALFITHLHADHIGGLPALLDSGIPIRQIYLPYGAGNTDADPLMLAIIERAREHNIPITSLAAGDFLRYNHFTLSVLWPERGKVRPHASPNQFSMVLKTEFSGYSVLSMADVGEPFEMISATPADVLKVGHHGSASGTSDAFLQAVHPAVSILTTSATSNSLPADSTVNRLVKSGTGILRTDRTGDITLSVRNHRLRVQPYRGEP